MKTQTYRIAEKIAKSKYGIVTVGELCKMKIPRYSARMHDLKKRIGLSWEYNSGLQVYKFSIDARGKCWDWMCNVTGDDGSTQVEAKSQPEPKAPQIEPEGQPEQMSLI